MAHIPHAHGLVHWTPPTLTLARMVFVPAHHRRSHQASRRVCPQRSLQERHLQRLQDALRCSLLASLVGSLQGSRQAVCLRGSLLAFRCLRLVGSLLGSRQAVCLRGSLLAFRCLRLVGSLLGSRAGSLMSSRRRMLCSRRSMSGLHRPPEPLRRAIMDTFLHGIRPRCLI
jgi:hypothetical protein